MKESKDQNYLSSSHQSYVNQSRIITWVWILIIVSGLILFPTFNKFDFLFKAAIGIILFNIETLLITFLVNRWVLPKLSEKRSLDIINLKNLIQQSINKEHNTNDIKKRINILDQRRDLYDILNSSEKFNFMRNILFSIVGSIVYIIFYFNYSNQTIVLTTFWNNFLLMTVFIFSFLTLTSVILRLVFFLDSSTRER